MTPFSKHALAVICISLSLMPTAFAEKNIAFALSVNPNNTDLLLRDEHVSNLKITIPSTLGEELKTNPFLNCISIEAFKALRDLKDQY